MLKKEQISLSIKKTNSIIKKCKNYTVDKIKEYTIRIDCLVNLGLKVADSYFILW